MSAEVLDAVGTEGLLILEDSRLHLRLVYRNSWIEQNLDEQELETVADLCCGLIEDGIIESRRHTVRSTFRRTEKNVSRALSDILQLSLIPTCSCSVSLVYRYDTECVLFAVRDVPNPSWFSDYVSLKYLMEICPLGFALYDVDSEAGGSTALYLSDRYCEITQVAREVIQTEGIPAIGARVHPDDLRVSDIISTDSIARQLPAEWLVRIFNDPPVAEYRWMWYAITPVVSPSCPEHIFLSCCVDDVHDTASLIGFVDSPGIESTQKWVPRTGRVETVFVPSLSSSDRVLDAVNTSSRGLQMTTRAPYDQAESTHILLRETEDVLHHVLGKNVHDDSEGTCLGLLYIPNDVEDLRDQLLLDMDIESGRRLNEINLYETRGGRGLDVIECISSLQSSNHQHSSLARTILTIKFLMRVSVVGGPGVDHEIVHDIQGGLEGLAGTHLALGCVLRMEYCMLLLSNTEWKRNDDILSKFISSSFTVLEIAYQNGRLQSPLSLLVLFHWWRLLFAAKEAVTAFREEVEVRWYSKMAEDLEQLFVQYPESAIPTITVLAILINSILEHPMTDAIVLSMIRAAPSEAIMLLSGLDGEVIEVSKAGKKILEDFGAENILACVRSCCLDDGHDTKEFQLVQIENVNCRQKFLGRETVGLRFTARTLKLESIADDAVVVYIQRLPVYEELLDKNEMMEFLLETLPKGVALHKIDPETGKTSHPIINRKMAELCGGRVDEMRKEGSYVVTGSMQDEEREYLESVVTDAYANLSNASFTVNTLRANGQYAPVRFSVKCYADDGGKLQGTAMAEEGIESDIEHVSVRRSARLMLSSFLSAVFDVSFYVNSKFQFIEDSPRVRYFFSTEPTFALQGKPLEVFMTLDEDKHRFKEYMVRSLEQQMDSITVPEESTNVTTDPLFQSPSRLVHSVAPMIKIRLSTAENILSDCQVFATPTYCGTPITSRSMSIGSMESSSSSSVSASDFSINTSGSGGGEPVYLVGVRVLRASVHGTGIPPVLSEELNTPSKSPKYPARTVHNPPSTLTLIPEERPSDLGVTSTQEGASRNGEAATSGDPEMSSEDHKSSSSGSSSDSSSSGSAHRGALSVDVIREHGGILIGSKLIRDVTFCMNDLVTDSSEGRVRFNPEVIHSRDDWLVPLYEHYDYALTEQELLLLLPNSLQNDFVTASRQLNYFELSQILTFSTEGNLGILQKIKGSRITKNAYMLQLVFRFFFGMVFQLDEGSVHQLMIVLQTQLSSIARKHLTRTEHRIVQLHFSLALIAAATRFPSTYTTNATDMEWLRKSLITALTLQSQCTTKVKSMILPIVYFMCLIWASLMKRIDRTDEGVNLLATIYDDIRQFCGRHPYCVVSRQIQACICYNIAVTSLRRHQLKRAFHWLSNLQGVIQVPYIEFPPQCDDILQWARHAQERAESQ